MTVIEAVENLRICKEEFEAADFTCRNWIKVCGPGIWSEGHPSNRAKLRRRRRAKLDPRSLKSLYKIL